MSEIADCAPLCSPASTSSSSLCSSRCYQSWWRSPIGTRVVGQEKRKQDCEATSRGRTKRKPWAKMSELRVHNLMQLSCRLNSSHFVVVVAVVIIITVVIVAAIHLAHPAWFSSLRCPCLSVFVVVGDRVGYVCVCLYECVLISLRSNEVPALGLRAPILKVATNSSYATTAPFPVSVSFSFSFSVPISILNSNSNSESNLN